MAQKKMTSQTDLGPVFALTRRLVQDIFRRRSQELILCRAPRVWAFFIIRTRGIVFGKYNYMLFGVPQ